MLRKLGPCPAIICAATLFLAHTCAGQTTVPPAGVPVPVAAAPAPASAPPPGPVVVGAAPSVSSDVNPADAKAPAATPGSPATGAPNGVKPPATQTTTQTTTQTAAQTHDASAAYTTPSRPYVIGALDVLDVGVYGSPNLSGFKDVGSDGMITMPLIGEIRADGLTKQQLAAVIRDKLAASVFVDPPEVTVQVVRVNSKKYFILGGVNRQGEFPLMGPTTVLDAFANTGGFHDFAQTNKIYILRGDRKIPFNYKQVIQGKNMKQNIQIENGDHIVVPEK